MEKRIEMEDVASFVKSGDVVMVGGFLGCGSPNKIMSYLAENTDLKNFTIVCNDTAFEDIGVGRIIANKKAKKIIASHIGTNKETGRQMAKGETEVILTPQGTLVEQIRAAGFGLGGVLTKTGLGIKEVENSKQKIKIREDEWLLEEPIYGDVSFISGAIVDTFGNVKCIGSTSTFNKVMAFASKVVIVEAEKIVDVGTLDPNDITIPGILIDYIVDGSKING